VIIAVISFVAGAAWFSQRSMLTQLKVKAELELALACWHWWPPGWRRRVQLVRALATLDERASH
jgi:hypothetical protein